MKETLEAKLVYTTERQRFYKLNRIVDKFPRKIDLVKEIDDTIPYIKPTHKEVLTPIFEACKQGVDVICVSDAHTHIERLVFAGCEYTMNGETKYTSVSMLHIDGKLTMMIYGGNSKDVHPDEVYLRRIAAANGYTLQINQ